MGIRKKKTVRDQLEDRLDDFLTQAEDLRKQVSDRAPDVRDNLAARLDAGLAELRTRWPEIRDEVLDRVPEMSEETYDKLPNGVADKHSRRRSSRPRRSGCASWPSSGWSPAPGPRPLRRGPPSGRRAATASAAAVRRTHPAAATGRRPRPVRGADRIHDERHHANRAEEEGHAEEEVTVSAGRRCLPTASARTRSARSTPGSAPRPRR